MLSILKIGVDNATALHTQDGEGEVKMKYDCKLSIFIVFIDWLWELIFPARCVFCRIDFDGGGWACTGCLNRLRPAEIALPSSRHVDEYYGVFAYEEPLREAILQFKDNGRVASAKFFARVTFEAYADLANDFDIIVPVPLHKNRLRQRGFNQAEAYGQRLAWAYKKPIYNGLERVKDTKRLYEVKSRRDDYVKNAFALRRGFVTSGQRVLLVDDILTSGATVGACAAALKAAGADGVIVLAIAATPQRRGDH